MRCGQRSPQAGFYRNASHTQVLIYDWPVVALNPYGWKKGWVSCSGIVLTEEYMNEYVDASVKYTYYLDKIATQINLT